MEIKEYIKEEKIIGIVSSYKSNLKLDGKVSDLKIKNINNALKMVGLDDSFINKDLKDLTISELWKVELATKLDNDIIVIGNLSDSLIYKDREFIKKLLIKLSNEYNKKIIVIDNNINSFISLVKKIFVLNNKKVIYETSDFFNNELYKYVRMPKIIDFIKYVNKDNKRIDNTTDIYELIKDIYRRVS